MARVRTGAGELARKLGACQEPVYLLDSRRVLLYANPACFTWLGFSAEQLIGQQCNYQSGTDVGPLASTASSLCPTPELLAVPSAACVLSVVDAAGRIQQRQAQLQMLHLTEEGETATLVIVGGEDVQEAGSLATGQSTPAELHVLLRWLRQSLAARGVLDRWVGDLPAVRRVRDQFQAAAQSRARAVLVGPKGAGREDLARAIHYRPQREAHGPLVPIDCAVVDAESLQAAILSVVRNKVSFPADSMPAVLLVDVDKLVDSAQDELLGFLQLPGFAVRTLATAQTSLLALAESGKFRRDLGYALSTIVIELPALVERRAELPLVAQAIVEEYNASGGKQLSGCTSEALDRLAAYAWPGDLAQLAEALHTACAQAAGSQITAADLPPWLHQAEQAAAHPRRSDERIILDEFLADVERELIARAMQRTRGNKAKAAKLLGISRPRLLRRIEQLGLASSRGTGPG